MAVRGLCFYFWQSGMGALQLGDWGNLFQWQKNYRLEQLRAFANRFLRTLDGEAAEVARLPPEIADREQASLYNLFQPARPETWVMEDPECQEFELVCVSPRKVSRNELRFRRFGIPR
jgi:hypothetical protein